MSTLWILCRTALVDLRQNKVRTTLTSLGILIGVLAVVLLIAFGLGLRNYIEGRFENLGTNLIIVFPGRVLSEEGKFRDTEGFGGGISFDEKDVVNLQKLRRAAYIVPVFVKTARVSAKGETKLADLYATTSDIFPIRHLELHAGQFFTKSDVRKRTKKVVIGPKIAEKLFGGLDGTLGKTIRLGGQRFTVVGVTKEKGGGGFGGPDFDSYIYIPYTAATAFNPDKKFLSLYIEAKTQNDIPQLKANIEQSLLKQHDKDDFTVVEQTEILAVITQIFGVMNTVLVAIGSISLVVGGVGIMNIMYATVTERMKEIGIRRALGATKRDILLQFLTQAVIVSLFGGLLGLLLATGIIFAVQQFFPAAIHPLSVAAALGVSSCIGIFFGVFPAKRAADLNPIDAIRYE